VQNDHLNEPQVTEAEVQAVMEKYDRESVTRNYKNWIKWLVFGVCILFSLVQLYAAFTGRVAATQLRPLHLGFVMTLVFLIYPVTKSARRDKLPIYDAILAVIAMAVCLYIALQHVELARRINKNTALDIWVGGLLIVLLFECCRRVVGLPIMVVALVFMLYAYFGQYMPGDLMHRGFSVRRIITQLVYTTEGIMGTPLGASSTFIFLFVMFGAFLERTEVGNFFIDFANAIAGHKRGGPAKVAVLASALEGTVSGSSVANTVGSGSFTIPMMKRLGYRKEFAAAVEAAASTGGQIMPPVMGAAAFLMAESVGVPYMEVVKAALIPAILYFVGIYIIIELEARKYGLEGMEGNTAQIPAPGQEKRLSDSAPDRNHRIPFPRLYPHLLCPGGYCLLRFLRYHPPYHYRRRWRAGSPEGPEGKDFCRENCRRCGRENGDGRGILPG